MPAMQRASLLAAIVATGLVACGSESVDPRAAECADYCDLIEAHCTGGFDQYSDRDSCLSTCEAMPLGDQATHSGHTIMCRTFTAAIAELTPAFNCAKAGPGGDGTCGGNCESFCAMADEICTDDNQAFASIAECMGACTFYNTTPVYDASRTSGDTFACRLYHLTAASNDPRTHCAHIGPTSPVCF